MTPVLPHALHLHQLSEGNGPAVVLSHALGADMSMWDGVVPLLMDEYTVFRYDARGHGQSDAPPGPYTMEMLADDAAALIQRELVGPVHFVGLSMGGMTGQALAAKYPELVKTLTIANSSSYYDADARRMWQARVDTVLDKGVPAIGEGAMVRWFTPEFRADFPAPVARLRAGLEGTDAKAYAAACGAVGNIDFRESNKTITCPTQVIGGTRDEATPMDMSEQIRREIPGAQLYTIDAAHLSAVEQPAEFARLVVEFLRKNA